MIVKMPGNEKGCFDVKITDKNGNFFVMTVAGNLDLYWVPQNRNCSVFEIDSSDAITFGVFEQLFGEIKQVDDKYSPTLKGDTITFISEDRHEDYANVLSITKAPAKIKINFLRNENKDEFGWHHMDNVICFCNSGSRVPEVEHVFMEMFIKLAYESDFVKNESIAGKEL